MAESSSPPKRRGRPPKPDAEKSQSETWDFTEWILTDERLAFWKRLEYRYLGIFAEVCPDTGRRHWQCRIIFRRNYRHAQLKKIFPPGVHFEATKCSVDFNYGKKYDSITVFEEDLRQRGRRNIFREQKLLIQSGSRIRDLIALPESNGQSLRSAECLMAYIEPPREWGSVRAVFDVPLEEIYKLEQDLYRPPIDGERLKFWTGYDAHEAVVIDCALHKIDRLTLRQWISPAPFLVNTKFGARQARYKRIYVIRPPDDFVVSRAVGCCSDLPHL